MHTDAVPPLEGRPWMADHLDDQTPLEPDASWRRRIHDQVARRRRRRRGVVAMALLAPLVVAAGSVVYLRSQAGELEHVEVGGLTPVTAPQPTGPAVTTDESSVPVAASSSVEPADAPAPVPVDVPLNVVLVGVDERGPDEPDTSDGSVQGSRADTIAIARIDPLEQRVALLSIPRDLWVEHDGRAGRINSYWDAADPSALVAAITGTFAIEINHYVAVDFAGFRRLVDLAGGVNVPFDRAVRDRHTGFHADRGCRTLDGASTLAYARSRRLEAFDETTEDWTADPTSDIGRIGRQQDLIRRLYTLILGTDYGTADEVRILTDVVDDLTVDEGLDIGRLRALFATAAQIGVDRFEAYDLNSGLTGSTIDGQAVLELDPEVGTSVVEQFLGMAATGDAPPSTEVPPAAVRPADVDC